MSSELCYFVQTLEMEREKQEQKKQREKEQKEKEQREKELKEKQKNEPKNEKVEETKPIPKVKKKRGRKINPNKKHRVYSECGICGDDHVSEGQTVACEYCKYKSCKTCLKYFILSKTEPRCMNCKELFTEDFIYMNITKAFYEKEFKNHKNNLIVQMEKSKIPGMMPDIALYKRGNDITNTHNKSLHLLMRIYNPIMNCFFDIQNFMKNSPQLKIGEIRDTARYSGGRMRPHYENNIFTSMNNYRIIKTRNFSADSLIQRTYQPYIGNIIDFNIYKINKNKDLNPLSYIIDNTVGVELANTIINQIIMEFDNKSMNEILALLEKKIKMIEDNTFEPLKMDKVNDWMATLPFRNSENNVQYKMGTIMSFPNNSSNRLNINKKIYTKSKTKLLVLLFIEKMVRCISQRTRRNGQIQRGYHQYNDMESYEKFVIKNGGFLTLQGEIKKTKRKRINYVSKCPGIGCNGLVNERYMCELCNSAVCRKCLEIIGVKEEGKELPEHTCDENNLASARMIKSQTKPCPKCSARILKISGCNQMWCTNCNVAFDWASNTIIKGRIHNPHYFQWLKSNRRTNTTTTNTRATPAPAPATANEVVCGGIPRTEHLQQKLDNDYFKSACKDYWEKGKDRELINMFDNVNVFGQWIKNYWMDVQRLALHIDGVYLRPLRHRIGNWENNKTLTTRYVLKEYSEEHYKSTIINREINREYIQNRLDIYEMLSAVINESLREIYNSIPLATNKKPEKTPNLDDMFTLYNSVNSVIVYGNAQLTKSAALRKFSIKDIRFKTIKKNNKVIVININEFAYSIFPRKCDVKRNKEILHFTNTINSYSVQQYQNIVGREERMSTAYYMRKQNHIWLPPAQGVGKKLCMIEMDELDKIKTLDISKLEINHLYRSHSKFYADRLKEVKKNTSMCQKITYIWTKKKEKKEIPNFEYIENIGIWNAKKETHNFNGSYVGKGYYYYTLIGEGEKDKDDNK